jgi:hypothetical protein
MPTRWLLTTGPLLLVTVCLVPIASAGMKVTPNKENVVASRLEGKWVVEPKLTQRLYGQPRASSPPGDEVEFISDPAVAEKVPEKYEKALKGRPIYMAGTMKVKGAAHPFILVEMNGNPHLVYFREKDGDPMGDGESFILMLAVAKNRADDLLLTGGDFNNQAFSAFERAERAAAK